MLRVTTYISSTVKVTLLRTLKLHTICDLYVRYTVGCYGNNARATFNSLWYEFVEYHCVIIFRKGAPGMSVYMFTTARSHLVHVTLQMYVMYFGVVCTMITVGLYVFREYRAVNTSSLSYNNVPCKFYNTTLPTISIIRTCCIC